MMNTQTVNKIDELITASGQIGIAFPGDPDVDTAAAALSLYLSLTKIGKSVSLVSPTPATVALGNLVGIDKVKQSMGGNGGNGLIISLPYQQGSIEKISYDIVGDRINLTVVPGAQGLNFTTDDISYQSPSQAQADLLFAVGIAQEDELLTIAPSATGVEVVNIDNNPANGGYGSAPLVDTASSSLCEIVTNFLTMLNLPLDLDIAQNLLSGIVEKTDNFQNENTSPSAFEAAAPLLQKGAQRRMGQRSFQPPPQPQAAKPAFPFPQEQSQRPNTRPFGHQGQQGGQGLQNPFGRQDNRNQLKGQDNRNRMPFPAKNQAPKFSDAPKPQNQPRPIPADNNVKVQNGVKGQTQPPQDWLEPKIYSGKTPVS